jgi:hypothetical protein
MEAKNPSITPISQSLPSTLHQIQKKHVPADEIGLVVLSSPGDAFPEEDKMIKSAKFYVSFVAIGVVVFLVSLDLLILPASLPAIALDLQAASSEAYWSGAGYILAQGVSQPIFGGISETFGRKLMLQVSLLIFLVASILCARAQSIRWLIGTRVVSQHLQLPTTLRDLIHRGKMF